MSATFSRKPSSSACVIRRTGRVLMPSDFWFVNFGSGRTASARYESRLSMMLRGISPNSVTDHAAGIKDQDEKGQKGSADSLSAQYIGEMIETRGHGCP